MPVDEEIIERPQHHQRPDQPKRDFSQIAFEQLRIAASLDADPRQHRSPNARTYQGKDRVAQEIHFDNAHVNADQVPHHRQQTLHKNT